MHTLEELSVFFEQFDLLPNTPHLPLSIKLNLFSKLHETEKSDLKKMIQIINCLFEKAYIDETELNQMLHQNLNTTGMIEYLVMVLVKSIPNHQYQDIFDILQLDTEKQKIFILLDDLNIIHPDNFILMLSYFCQYELNPNLLMSLDCFVKLKKPPSKEKLEQAFHDCLKRFVECYFSLILIEQNFYLNPLLTKLAQTSKEPLLVAHILNLENVSKIFESPHREANIELLQKSNYPENTLMMLYLIETHDFPQSFVQMLRKKLVHLSHYNVFQLHQALTYIVMNPDMKFEDYDLLLRETGHSFHIVKFYHRLTQQHLKPYFHHILENTTWLDREILLNMFVSTIEKNPHAEDIMFFFFKHLPYCKSYEDSFNMFQYLLEHNIHEKDIGEETFHKLLFIHSKKIAKVFITFKQLDILTPELTTHLLSPDTIIMFNDPQNHSLFKQLSLDTLYRQFLKYYPIKQIEKGLKCIQILFKNNLLTLENLDKIREKPSLDETMNFLEMYDSLGRLNQVTLLNICAPANCYGFFSVHASHKNECQETLKYQKSS